MATINSQMAGVPYTEQNHLPGQNDVRIILFSLAYITLIRLPFCLSTERENFH